MLYGWSMDVCPAASPRQTDRPSGVYSAPAPWGGCPPPERRASARCSDCRRWVMWFLDRLLMQPLSTFNVLVHMCEHTQATEYTDLVILQLVKLSLVKSWHFIRFALGILRSVPILTNLQICSFFFFSPWRTKLLEFPWEWKAEPYSRTY